MKSENIRVLDCTLRDGGYVNNWEFDSFVTKRIMDALCESQVDIIECGFLSDRSQRLKDSTLYKTIEDIEEIINKVTKEKKHMFVAMINYGEYKIEKLRSSHSLNGIRIAFHKKDWKNALNEAEKAIEMGYKVFLQPMVTLSYTDEEFLNLIKEANKLDVYAFYIADSFGAMRKEDILRMSYLIDHNLRKDIICGLHAHNNLQLAYSNAIEFLNIAKEREVIIDSSIFGMGRSAGNLTTELFLNYLIENYKKPYKIEPLLDIIDKYLSRIHRENYWGYSIAHYLSAIYNCHPNYSNYLVNKKTLTIKNIEEILRNLHEDKKTGFDIGYIEKLYTDFNSKLLFNNDKLVELKKEMIHKDIHIVASGKSILDNVMALKSRRSEKILISVNYALNEIDSDYYFFSNQKRYTEYLEKVSAGNLENKNRKFIFTSNIKPIKKHKDSIFVTYSNLLGEGESKDNSMIMLLNLIHSLKLNDVFVSGFDGYSNLNSYLEKNMEYEFNNKEFTDKNKNIVKELQIINNKININFITPSIYEEYMNKYKEERKKIAN